MGGRGSGFGEEDCNACDNLKQLSSMTGGAIFSDLQKTGRSKSVVSSQSRPSETEVAPPVATKPRGSEGDEGEQRQKEADIPLERPINFEELGQATWGLIHTMAAYYPDNPTETRKEATRHFVESLGEVYPCHHCATDFQEELKQVPLRADSREEFSQWACEIHNVINEKLGKDIFPCTQVDRRWRFDASQKDELFQ